jgi:ABC-type multidrug transport system permease subunit
MGLVSLVGLIFGTCFYDLSYDGFVPALIWAMFTGVTLFLLALTLQVFASSHRAGSVLTSLVIFPLMMLGGSFFPSETMPGWMAAVGGWTPNGIGVERLKDILLSRADPGSLARSTAILGALSIVLLAISLRRIKRSFVVG